MADFPAFLANSVVIGIGWTVVHHLSRQRDLDKSRRELIVRCAEGIHAAASQLLLKAIQYHASSRDPAVEREIVTAMQDIAQRLAAVSNIVADKDTQSRCMKRMIEVRKSITGVHFEDEHSGALSAADPEFQRMAQGVADFKRSLLDLQYSQYKSG
jgi:hypothetical protein